MSVIEKPLFVIQPLPFRARLRRWWANRQARALASRAQALLDAAELYESDRDVAAHNARMFREAAHTAQLQADLARDGQVMRLRKAGL